MDNLTVMRDPLNSDNYIAKYSADEPHEIHNLAFRGSLRDAITEALDAWGLAEDDVYIEASNWPN